MITLIVSTIGCIFLTPFILLIVASLAILAFITSTLTSSFIFLRLALLAIEIISGLTLESTNWLLSTCLTRIRMFISTKSNQSQPQSQLDSPTPSIKRRKLPTSLSLSKLPYKAQIKSKYSTSVPGTPDPESYHQQMAI